MGRGSRSASWRRLLRHPVLWISLGMALVVIWVFYPVVGEIGSSIIGDESTDAIRGMWTFDHIRHALVPPETPLWTTRLNFPSGALVLVVPLPSSIVAAPLGFLFGPVAGWNLSLALLLWMSGMATALLVWTISRSVLAGFVAGAILIVQPMLLHAVADGTAEHVAFWGVPAFLACVIFAVRRRTKRWGVAAALLALVVALDSPYNVVFAATLSVCLLPGLQLREAYRQDRRALLSTGLSALGVLAIGGGLLMWLFMSLPIDEVGGSNMAHQQGNAVDLNLWWDRLFRWRKLRDPTQAQAFIPASFMISCVVLGGIGALRSLPWLLIAPVMFVLAFGTSDGMPLHMFVAHGSAGKAVGDAIVAINEVLYELPGFSSIRFPRRWLVPMGFALVIGGGIGLARVFHWIRSSPLGRGRRGDVVTILLAVLLAGGAVHRSLDLTRFHSPFPRIQFPTVAFAEWLAVHPEPGAVLMQPQWLPAGGPTLRHEASVYANIDQRLRPSEFEFFQVVHGRAVLRHPQEKTILPSERDERVGQVVFTWQDLATPYRRGEPITDEERRIAGTDQHRQEAIDFLVDSGYRFLVLDLSLYEEPSLELIRKQLGTRLAEERRFDDGDGVLVMRLEP